MKNKLPDLNDHLFAQMERLSDESLKGEKLKEEIDRAKAVSSIAKDITNNAALALDAQKFIHEATGRKPSGDSFLGIEHGSSSA